MQHRSRAAQPKQRAIICPRIKRTTKWLTPLLALMCYSAASRLWSAPAVVSAAPDSKLVAAGNRLGFDLFANLRASSPTGNIFISPVSISTALAMVYSGAAGATRDQMARTLGLAGMSHAEVNSASAMLLRRSRSSTAGTEVDIANALWVRRGFTLRPDFVQRVRNSFGAKATVLDFGSPSAAATINAWVKENTHDRIDKIIDRISPDARLFVANAVYFKGAWSSAFSKSETKDHPFTLTDGKRATVPLMRRGGEFQYFEDPTFQAVSLPYRDGGYRMIVFLPKPGVTLSTLCKSLSLAHWNAWMARFQGDEGVLELPRFTMTYDVTLNSALAHLGMAGAFQRQADFTGISAERPLFISDVKHKAYLKVDEAGTEAAAVTSIGLSATAVRVSPRPPFRMVVDHPFVCAISDQSTGAILFLGVIQRP